MSTPAGPTNQDENPPAGLPVAEVIHELRAPLAAMLGYAELLSAADIPPDQRAEHAETIRRNAGQLLRLVNDLLDASQAERDALAVQPARCEPAAVAADVCQLLAGVAAARGLELRCDAPAPSAIPAVRTDAARLRQILINLAGNAIRFTDRGRVTLRLTADTTADTERPIRLRFEVQDTGIGLSPAQFAQLTKSGTPSMPTNSTRAGGSGLGLLISRKLAHALGGSIEVHSQPGRGSTFTLILPCQPAPGSAESVEREPPLPGTPTPLPGRILLVEDDPDTARLIALHLRRAGAEVHAARDGRAGVEMALASRSQGQEYDLVLFDLHLPVVDGFAAAAILRRQRWSGPIAALSADSCESTRESCREAGCSELLSKTCDAAALIAGCAALIVGPRITDVAA